MKKPKCISLFTGAGGLDLGLEAAGFETAVALEMDREAAATLRANRRWPIIDRDVHTVSTQEMLTAAGVQPGEADLLAGGPPCQPFSKSGYWHTGDAKRLNDPRAETLDAYLRVLREALPKTFLLENVPGLAFNQKSEGLKLLRDTIKTINKEVGVQYTVSALKLNAVEFGVPQKRERVFVIGSRDGVTFEFPRPTHAKPPSPDMSGLRKSNQQPLLDDDQTLLMPTTAWDAIGHLGDDDPRLKVRGKWAGLLPSIPEGHNYLFHTDRGGGLPIFGWRRHYWSHLLKLAKSRPSWTLTAQPGPAIGPFHWNSRRLSSSELCALQTFPADYRIIGKLAAVYRQVGNAVPSALAELLGREIRSQLLGQKAPRGRLTLLPVPKKQIPPPEKARRVRKRYLSLVGEHAAHPGTGKGTAARARQAATMQP